MPERISIRKTRRLRPLLAKHYSLPEPADPKEAYLDKVVMAILWQDAPAARVRLAWENLREEFVDWNELRVTVTSDVAAILESCGLAGSKAAVLKRVLSRAVEDLYSLDFDLLCSKSREQLKTWFIGIEGLPHSTAAFILYKVYGYDRVLVDSEIARVVHWLGLVSEMATEEEIEAGLARVVPAREAHFTYHALREHALKICTKRDFDCRTCPLHKECDTGTRRLAEEDAAARAAKEAAKSKTAERKPGTKAAKDSEEPRNAAAERAKSPGRNGQ